MSGRNADRSALGITLLILLVLGGTQPLRMAARSERGEAAHETQRADVRRDAGSRGGRVARCEQAAGSVLSAPVWLPPRSRRAEAHAWPPPRAPGRPDR